MLADEVTHVKMGSDWLRRLTEKDPERRERALEFQRTVDKIFSLGGFRGESEENPIQLARRFRELAGFTDEEHDEIAETARQAQEEAAAVAQAAEAAGRLSDAFAAAPPDIDLTLAERAAWDVWTHARAGRLGLPTRPDRMRYDFRLQHGFSDATDAAFDRLWDARTLTWDGLREICK